MNVLLVVSVSLLVVGVVGFIVGVWLLDWRAGLSATGFALAAGSLLIDDGRA